MSSLESRLEARGDIPRRVSRQNKLAKGNFLATLRIELAATEADVGGLAAKQMRGQRCQLGPELLCSHVDSGSADRGGAAAECTDAVRNRESVAVDHVYILRIDTELIGNELCEGSLLALAVRRRAGEYRDFTGRLDADGAALPAAGRSCGGRTDSAYLNIGRNSNTVVLALLPTIFLSAAQAVVT